VHFFGKNQPHFWNSGVTDSIVLPSWLRHHPARWQADTLDRDALRAAALRLRERANFQTAARQLATEMHVAFQSHWAVNQLMNEQGRFAFLAFVMCLHHTRNADDPASGVTYSRVRDLFAKSNLAGPTRVKAMLALARLRGQLHELRDVPGADRRLRVLVPTQKLTAPASLWLGGLLRAAALLKPLPLPPDQLIALPEILGAVLTYNVHAYDRSQFMLHEDYPQIRELMSHEFGYLFLMMLIRHMRRESSGEVVSAVPISDFAEQFSASRGTVRNLLQFAQTHGWLRLKTKGGHEVALSESFADQAERWVALELEWAGEFAALATVEQNVT
jgi:hypothetical protein